MTLQQKYDFLIQYFAEHNPDAASELEFRNSFELIVAVVLSAQCTDKRVNIVTKGLFAQFPTPEAMAKAEVSEIYELIKSVSYPNNKAKHLSGLAKMLVSDFNGQVPSTMEELTRLPGVGRKTANVILAIVYDQPATPTPHWKSRNSSPPTSRPKPSPSPTTGSSCTADTYAPPATPSATSAD